MGICCNVLGCKNRQKTGSGISFHQFPLKNKPILDQWIAATKRRNWQPKRHSSICSEHFDPDSYEKRHSDQPPKLRPNAVPLSSRLRKLPSILLQKKLKPRPTFDSPEPADSTVPITLYPPKTTPTTDASSDLVRRSHRTPKHNRKYAPSDTSDDSQDPTYTPQPTRTYRLDPLETHTRLPTHKNTSDDSQHSIHTPQPIRTVRLDRTETHTLSYIPTQENSADQAFLPTSPDPELRDLMEENRRLKEELKRRDEELKKRDEMIASMSQVFEQIRGPRTTLLVIDELPKGSSKPVEVDLT